MPRLLVALVALVVLGGGCHSAPTAAANRAAVSAAISARIEVVNPGLGRRCEIVSGRALYEGDILVAAVLVRSHWDTAQILEYRWTWYDADDLRQETSSKGWRSLRVDSLEEKQVTARAPQRNALRGVFELRCRVRN